jgi:hypothetical protein
MKKLITLISALAVLGLIAGCGGQGLPTEPQSVTSAASVRPMIPAGATVDSAWLQLYVSTTATSQISLHPATAMWEESSVTWNSFAGAYDASPAGAFSASDTGWVMINVSDVVGSWVGGFWQNFGLLMKMAPDTVASEACFKSRENGAMGPILKLFCTMGDSMHMEMLMAGADATLHQAMPDSNLGADSSLYVGTGGIEGPMTQSLVWFDIVVEVDEGCTRSKGYWKNHAGLGPQEDVVSDLLPLTLGDGGGKSLMVNTPDSAVMVLQQHTFGHPSNGITKLYAQLLAAKLNIAYGAASDDVDDVLSDADAFLSDHCFMDWDSLNKDQRHNVQMWKDKLDAYNNGETGPGHCGDDDDHDDGEEMF